MNFFRDFFKSFSAYGQAAGILFSRKFAWFMIFPVLFMVLLILVGQYFVALTGDSLIGYLNTVLLSRLEEMDWFSWMPSVLSVIVKLILMLSFFFLFLTFGGYLVLIFMSPVFSLLSERVEAHITGNKYVYNTERLVNEILRGILIALRNMLFQFLLSILLFFCTFIPIVGFLSPIALFLVSVYFYGFSFVDYTLERRYYGIRDSVRYVNRNTGTVMGIGFLFAFSLLIPWLRIIVCCFVSLLSVIAGTIAVTSKENEP